MKNLKILLAILLVIALLTTLVACGVTPNGTDNGDNNGNENETSSGNDQNKKPNGGTSETSDAKILVVYFSATGTTEKIANYIKSYLNADIFEITPAVKYTNADLNYNDSNSRSSKENSDNACRPEIVGSVENISQYDTVFIGYPIWHGKAPKVMYTFIEQYDFSGKTIIPFCTAASSGIGSSATILEDLTTDATWVSGIRFLSSATQASVQAWVDGVLPDKEK